MTNATCSKCNIRERGSQSYCKECSREYKAERRRAKITPRDCIICASEYRSPYPHTLTCSSACGRERERRMLGQKALSTEPLTCPICFTAFTPRNSIHKFCSKGCTMVAHGKWSGNPRVGLNPLERVARRQASQLRWLANNPGYTRKPAKPETIHAAVLRRRARRQKVTTLPVSARDIAAKFAYWGGCCWMCSATATSIDHVKPIVASGPHMLSNLRPACGSCNSSKGGRWFGVSELSRFVKQ